MKIEGVAGEPWLPTDNLLQVREAPMIDRLPIFIAVSADLSVVHMNDVVDYISERTMTQADLYALADEIKRLADMMAPAK